MITSAVVDEGVEVVFAVMGDGNLKWLAHLEGTTDVRVVWARSEAAVVLMAEGYARATGKIGVCSVTCGPGLTLTATGLLIAGRQNTSLLVIAGDSPLADRNYNQKVDQKRFVEACEATAETIRSADTVTEDVAMAFYQARTSGPVVLSAAMDLQDEEYPWDYEYKPSTHMVVARQRIQADADSVAQAVSLIRDSDRTIILAGRGARGSLADIEEFAHRTGALLSTTLLSKGMFDGSPFDIGIAGLFSSSGAEEAFAKASCVLAIGTSLNHYTTEEDLLFPQATVIHIDVKPQALISERRRADCYIQGEAGVVLSELNDRLEGAGLERTNSAPAWLPDGFTRGPRTEMKPLSDEGLVDPIEAMDLLNKGELGNPRFVIGLGHFWWFPIFYLRGNSIDSFHISPGFGVIGQALPIALGAAVGRPDQKVVVIEGDSSLMMNFQEMESASRHGIDLLVIVMNDNGPSAEYHKLRARGMYADSAVMRSPDFAAMANAMGVKGETARSADELRAALDRFAREKGPALIDVKIDRRRTSDPYERLGYGYKPDA